MALERTLVIIKPDAVAKDVIGNISALIEASGLRIIAAKMMHLSDKQLKSSTPNMRAENSIIHCSVS